LLWDSFKTELIQKSSVAVKHEQIGLLWMLPKKQTPSRPHCLREGAAGCFVGS
jgi:hypothetical protein